jgi:hypothetical protein
MVESNVEGTCRREEGEERRARARVAVMLRAGEGGARISGVAAEPGPSDALPNFRLPS